MKLTALLLSAPVVALLAAVAGAPALPAFAIASAAFVLAIAIDDYRDRPCGYGYSRSRAKRPARLVRPSRRPRLPLAA